MLSLHWNEYELIKKKKYLVYFIGNFSPPHKSHLSLIKPYFNKKNIHILIHLQGNEEKHNVNVETSLKILKIYLKEVKNATIEKFDPSFQYIYSYKKLDFLLFIRGNENFNNTIKTVIQNEFSELIISIRKKGIVSLLLIKERTPNISSTEMCKHKGDNMLRFLPDYLSEEEKKEIISYLKDAK